MIDSVYLSPEIVRERILILAQPFQFAIITSLYSNASLEIKLFKCWINKILCCFDAMYSVSRLIFKV